MIFDCSSIIEGGTSIFAAFPSALPTRLSMRVFADNSFNKFCLRDTELISKLMAALHIKFVLKILCASAENQTKTFHCSNVESPNNTISSIFLCRARSEKLTHSRKFSRMALEHIDTSDSANVLTKRRRCSHKCTARHTADRKLLSVFVVGWKFSVEIRSSAISTFSNKFIRS